jgi:hypothetical protein
MCFFNLKCQNVWMLTKIYLYTYYYIPFLNYQSFHHWHKLCKSSWRAKSVSTSNMCQSSSCSSSYMYTTVSCYCLTLNGRTIFIKVHSIENNTIYVYKYNLLNWFFLFIWDNNNIILINYCILFYYSN